MMQLRVWSSAASRAIAGSASSRGKGSLKQRVRTQEAFDYCMQTGAETVTARRSSVAAGAGSKKMGLRSLEMGPGHG